jgi:hypothetical protein
MEKIEKHGNGLHIPTLGIKKKSNSQWCGQIHAIPFPAGKVERGNKVIMATSVVLIHCSYNQF